MAKLEDVLKYQDKFLPTLLKRNSDMTDTYPNEKGVELDKNSQIVGGLNQNYQVTLKSEITMTNYATCVDLSHLSCKYPYQNTKNSAGEPIDYVGSLSISKLNKEFPVQLILKNIWKPHNATNDVSQDTSFMRINKGYFFIYGPKEIVYCLANMASLDASKGRLDKITFDWNMDQDTENILKKLKFTTTSLANYSSANLKTFLQSIGITISDNFYDNYSPICLCEITLDGTYDWWSSLFAGTGGGYDIKFFSERVFDKCKMKIQTSRTCSDTNQWLSYDFEVPLKLTLKNDLVQVIESTYYSYSGADVVDRYCYYSQNSRWYEDFQIWCPDLKYLTYSVNQIGLNMEIEEKDMKDNKAFALYKYLKFKYTITEGDIGKIYFITFMFTYSKGEEYFQKTFNVRIHVERTAPGT